MSKLITEDNKTGLSIRDYFQLKGKYPACKLNACLQQSDLKEKNKEFQVELIQPNFLLHKVLTRYLLLYSY